ncbi:hypothetical protein ACIA49_07840 [Kribbella sp. NPDC051587]|uniref:hypothetical protein n=1 Tax=Kribbella sp. NPDC051587 TaxID=3364119 RepID=UPI0037882323
MTTPTTAPIGTPVREPRTAELIAAAVQAVPGVAGLHGGAFGDVATYLPGSQLAGVRITGDRVQIHLTTLIGHPVHTVADAVRGAVRPLTGQPVDVTIEDIALPTTS